MSMIYKINKFYRLITAIVGEEEEKTGRRLTEREALTRMSKDLRRKHIRRRIQEPLQAEQALSKIFHTFACKTDSLGIPLLREVL
jgi:Na+/phosphate symporter